MVFDRLFRRKPSAEATVAQSLYATIVATARQPVFYRDWGVADSVDGRFDLVVLHLSLLLVRIPLEHQAMRQNLIDIFCADMDANLREIGVGDVSVGKKVRRMAEAFQGRYEAYAQAQTVQELEQVLWRNVYRSGEKSSATQLTTYVANARAVLATQDVEQINHGKVHFQ